VSLIVGLITFLVTQLSVMFSRPKSLNVGSNVPDSMGFASLNSNDRTQTRAVQRLTLSLPELQLSDARDGPLEKQKSTSMAAFGHDVV
jgi:hypothetical protein